MSSVLPIWGNNPKEAFFRRKFQLPERFAWAVVRIFVDTGFELFLNERLVAVVDEWNNQRDYDRESGGGAWRQPLRTPGILV